ncbi:lamin tail domain-containing protein, partial [Actinacidiphila rubida]
MSRLASRLTATAVIAGAALAAAALPAAAADHGRYHYPQRSQVTLGAVHHGMSSHGYRGSAALNNEWITVANGGRHSVNLSGWTLSDRDHHSYRFSYLTLAPHASVRVHTGYGHNTRTDVYQDRHTSVWGNDDAATLRDDEGRFVASESWRYGDDRDHRGDNRGDNRDHRGDKRGDDRGDKRGDDRGDKRGDDHGDKRGDNHGDKRGDD